MVRKKARTEQEGPSHREEEADEADAEQQQAQMPEHLRLRHDYVVAGEHLNYHVSNHNALFELPGPSDREVMASVPAD